MYFFVCYPCFSSFMPWAMFMMGIFLCSFWTFSYAASLESVCASILSSINTHAYSQGLWLNWELLLQSYRNCPFFIGGELHIFPSVHSLTWQWKSPLNQITNESTCSIQWWFSLRYQGGGLGRMCSISLFHLDWFRLLFQCGVFIPTLIFNFIGWKLFWSLCPKAVQSNSWQGLSVLW